MSERIIRYIADPGNQVPALLNDLLAEKQVHLHAYQGDLTNDDVLEWILFAPYRSNDCYLSVESIWKKSLAKHNPIIKLILIGTIPGHKQNYFDVLNLPEDPTEIFRNALPVKDNWTPVSSGGVDVADKLKRFVDGHSASFDPDQSVREALGRIRKRLVLYSEELELGANKADIFENIFIKGIRGHHNTFIARWERYQLYFDALPFSGIFQSIGELAEKLDLHFKNRPSEENLQEWMPDAIALADGLYQHLVTIEQYVRE